MELIDTRFNTFFSSRQLTHEIIARTYEIPLRQIYFNKEDFEDDYKKVIYQLTHVLRELREAGLIEKYSRAYYKKNGLKKKKKKNSFI